MIPASKLHHKETATDKIMWKLAGIFVLVLFLLIPLLFIGGVIQERKARQQEVVSEIASTWAAQQQISGPILTVPYVRKSTVTDDKGKKSVQTNRFILTLFPADYRVKTQINPDKRYRGIYHSIVYNSTVESEGVFDLRALEQTNIPKENILWKEARLVYGITDTKGVEKQPEFKFNGKPLEALPGVESAMFLTSGLNAPVSIQPGMGRIPVQVNLSLKGSEGYSWAPIGKQSSIEVSSNWKTPSFDGALLPSHRNITAKGFKADWSIPYYNRNFNQVVLEDQYTDGLTSLKGNIQTSVVGVKLYTPVDSYTQTERATKYGLLFLVLTFATYFLFEIVSKVKVHAFQYAMVGSGMCLFYLLLIAFAEVIGFNKAYGVGSILMISVITWYSQSIFPPNRKNSVWIIGLLLSLMYAYLYTLLQLEDLALLFGSIGLLVVLIAVMAATRKINWYQSKTDPDLTLG